MRIGFIAGYQEIGEKVQRIAREMGMECFFSVQTDGSPESNLALARELIEDYGCEALLVRDALNYLTDGRLPVPVQCLETATIDVVKAIRKADSGKTVAFLVISNDELYTDYQTELSFLSGRKVRYFKIDARCSYEEAIKETKAQIEQADVLVTSAGPMARTAEEVGKEAIYIGASAFQITTALENLRNVLHIWEKEREYKEFLQLVLQSTERMYVAVRNGRIVLASEQLCSFADIARDALSALTAEEFFRKLPYYRQICEIHFEGVFTYQDTDFLMSRKTMMIGSDALIVYTIQYVSKIQSEEQQVRNAIIKKGFAARYQLEDIKTDSPMMENVKRMAAQFARSKNNVLIIGESGTGKEMFAQGIHAKSCFARGPFVAVNCAAIPSNLLESELFGYEGGSFTGARRNGKSGYFELSHNGTLFLDEIGELPLELQGKILRALQEKVVFRIGGEEPIPIHNRIICATNRNLFQMVKEGTFREDLFYRINVLSLTVPPLRERVEDIPGLSRVLLEEIYKEEEKFIFFDRFCLEALKNYQWPGNVRQLRAFLQRVVAVCDEKFDADIFRQLYQEEQKLRTDWTEDKGQEPTEKKGLSLEFGSMDEIEKQIIQNTLLYCGGSVTAAADLLKISRSTIWRKVRETG